MNTFSERLKTTRKNYPLTQHELAKKSGINRVTIANLEREDSESPRPSTVRALAEALDVDPTWLMSGEEGLAGKEAA